MKKILTPILVFSLALNLLLIAAIANQGFSGIPKVEALKDISQPGTYGPPAMEIIEGDASINANDVVLQNTLITGNLHLSEDISGGTITLQQVDVQGVIDIAGSGFTLLLSDCRVAKIALKGAGEVKLIARGASAIVQTNLASAGSLQEDSLLEGARGFESVSIETEEKVSLVGDFADLEVVAGDADLKFLRGEAALITIADSAAGTALELSPEVAVGSLAINGRAAVLGGGQVAATDINAPGLIILQGSFDEVYCRVEGIFLELQKGKISSLTVAELEQATNIALAVNTVVDTLTLNSRTGVTGEGIIGKAIINSGDITIDQMPGKVVIPIDLVVVIAGEEYKAPPAPEPEPEPEPAPKPVPEPEKPKITLNSISNVALLMVDKTDSRTIAVQPADASLTVTSSNKSILAVSLVGNKLTITGKGSGKATITVKATKAGYQGFTRTFTVTVKGPMDVKEFRLGDLTVGKKTVIVFLYAEDPSIYKVSVGGVELLYMPEQRCFYGEVAEADAKLDKVKVRK